MNDCLFCKIAAGTIPSDKVYEDANVVAFRDIDPKAPTHVLVIPKEHIESLADLKDFDTAAHIIRIIKQLSVSLGLKDGFRVVVNSGQDGGQTVSHLHFHLLGGRTMGWPPG